MHFPCRKIVLDKTNSQFMEGERNAKLLCEQQVTYRSNSCFNIKKSYFGISGTKSSAFVWCSEPERVNLAVPQDGQSLPSTWHLRE